VPDVAPPPRLLVFGDLGLDVVAMAPGRLLWGDDTPSRVHLLPGGQGGNVATWARRAGVVADLYTQVGDDPWGRFVTARARARGVHVHARPHGRTTRVVSLVEQHRRSLIADLGDGDWASPPARRPPGAALAYVSGYLLARPGGTARAVALRQWAASRGVRLAVTPSALSVIGRDAAEPWSALADGAWAILLNAAEACALTGAADAARRLARRHALALVTNGAHGAWLGEGGEGAGRVPAAAPAGPILDTTGAGDAAAGTFLARLACGDAPVDAARSAMAAAALACTEPGAWPPA